MSYLLCVLPGTPPATLLPGRREGRKQGREEEGLGRYREEENEGRDLPEPGARAARQRPPSPAPGTARHGHLVRRDRRSVPTDCLPQVSLDPACSVLALRLLLPPSPSLLLLFPLPAVQ